MRARFVVLLSIVLLAASAWALAAGKRPAEVAVACAGVTPGEPVLSRLSELCSTADETERERIHDLLRDARRDVERARISVDYPLDGTIFPPEITSPALLWHDDAADDWLVEVTFGDQGARLWVLAPGAPPPQGEIDPECISVTNEVYRPTEYQASAKAWRPDPTVWQAIKTHSTEVPTRISLLGYRADDPRRVVSRGEVMLKTSADPVGAPIFYRDVPLMPSATQEGVIKPLDQSAQPLIKWRLRDIGLTESRVMLANMPTCANCHSFSADGTTMGMDVDGPQGDKGAYAVAAIAPRVEIDDAQVFTWNAFEPKPRGHNTLGFMSRVSPDGRWVVSTVNEAIYVRNFWDYKFSQVFYPTRGILAYYERENGEIRALPGADDPDYVHCNAVWTPDGQTIIFARARARDPYERGQPLAGYAGDPAETPMVYDLYRIPFNGGRGGQAEPVAGASHNGMSNSFPKVSPDGKWLVWVQSKNGLLMRPDSKLWMVPVAGGEPRLMSANTSRMNSWHSFSPNSRWMVFSSKVNTPYTQMFLTHIDERGQDSPPVLIENSTAANRAVNLPEFVNTAYDRFTGISVPAVDHYEAFGRGNELARQGRQSEAVAAFEEALEGGEQQWRTNDWRIHDSLSKVLLQLGQTERALEHIYQSLRLNPYNAEMHANASFVLSETGHHDEALHHQDLALQLDPQDAKGWYNMATLRMKSGDRPGALAGYDRALELNPRYAPAWVARGIVRREAGDAAGARADLDAAIELNPNNPTALYFRALVFKELGDLAAAERDLESALVVAPPSWPRRPEMEALRAEIRASRPE